MPDATNPKKQSLMPSSKLRKALRAAGHHLSPIVQVGKEGLTEAVRRALDEQLLAHELVKVKVGTESPEDRFEIAAALAGEAGAQVAQVLGRTVLVYRKHPERPRFEAPDAETFANRGASLAERVAAQEKAEKAERRRSFARGRAGRAGPAGRRSAGGDRSERGERTGRGGGKGGGAGRGGGTGRGGGRGGGRR